jgi:hypothetical protein
LDSLLDSSGMERAGKKNVNNNDWQFWQQHNKPLEIKSQEMFNSKLDYIHQSPVQAGFVTKKKIGSIAVHGIFVDPIAIG